MAVRRIAFAWESFGPSHLDRIEAAAAAGWSVTAIEFSPASSEYLWEQGELAGARKVTLTRADERVGTIRLAWRLFRAVRRSGSDVAFLSHYNELRVFLAAVLLRLVGCRVITLMVSKFDDYPRLLWREVGKALMLAPYDGVLVASRRTADYMRFLGFRRRPIANSLDSLDLARLRRLGTAEEAVAHADRDFLIVARLVEKKNLHFALRAYAEWTRNAVHPRRLRIIGYGHLEPELRALAGELGIADRVVFMGVAESAQVCQAMRDALCLILPSTEEQFGFVVIEALAQGLPVLVSANAGAVDELIDNGVNGWIVDPYRPQALIAAMALLDRDETVWTKASEAANTTAERGDVRHFVSGVAALLGR
ncbi:glycosyltransferase [Novosphingobium sp. NPDC080210]|uniref:glycosyltransferase n=1 Tax=Novosphingobium sp. NPDC080210 TaxID=3390596 RepID=UPI003D05F813